MGGALHGRKIGSKASGQKEGGAEGLGGGEEERPQGPTHQAWDPKIRRQFLILRPEESFEEGVICSDLHLSS